MLTFLLSFQKNTQVANVKNNLLHQLEILGRWLACLVAIIAVVAFLLAMFHAGNNFKAAFESAVAIAVAIIPEGLPAMVGGVYIAAAVCLQPQQGYCTVVYIAPLQYTPCNCARVSFVAATATVIWAEGGRFLKRAKLAAGLTLLLLVCAGHHCSGYWHNR